MATIRSWLRVLGYLATLAVHISTMVIIQSPREKTPEDYRVLRFKAGRFKYLTVWNLGMQMAHAVLGLVCEYLLHKNSLVRDYRLPKYLRGARDKLFTNIVFPGSLLVAMLFWTIWHIDRELVFPRFLDFIVPPWANHIIHTFIVPVVLYETLLQPRRVPKSHVFNCIHIVVHCFAYLAVVLYTYYETGHWLYPIMEELSPPVFALFLLVIMAFGYVLYFAQWRLVELVWGDGVPSRKQKTEKIR